MTVQPSPAWVRPFGGPRRAATATVLAIVLAAAAAAPVVAHGPDPILSGGMFAQNQDLRFRWRAGAEPTSVIKTAIKAAAADASATRGSKAATFTYDAAGSNPIGYGIGATCGVNGLACFTRTAPVGFTMWLREQGHVFDWGTLKWCEAYATPPNGCYQAETIALDEFGHVEGLDHHVNYASNDDYVDAVVQTYSRTKPSPGYDATAFGRCDVATLQMQYDVTASTARYSTCLDLATSLALATTRSGNAITLTASLIVVDAASYVRLGGNPVSDRVVVLQRRAAGATTWITVGTMPAGTGSGTYRLVYAIPTWTEFRAIFKASTAEGLNGDTSPTVSVPFDPCTASARSALVGCL
jgi:hypothetical protein